MRIAFVGKGGAGKSTVAATVARLLARRGRDVLAVDSDPMPGLCFGLGLAEASAASPSPAIPAEAVVEQPAGTPGPRFVLRPGLDARAAIERYSALGADGVRLLCFEKSTGDWGLTARSQHAWSQIMAELPVDLGADVVGDLPGGTRQPLSGWGKYARTLLVVADPTPASLATARRLATLATSRWAPEAVLAVANRVRQPDDVGRVAAATGLTVIGAVPADPGVGQADRRGRAPLDADPHGPFITAVDALVDALIALDADRPRATDPSPTQESVA